MQVIYRNNRFISQRTPQLNVCSVRFRLSTKLMAFVSFTKSLGQAFSKACRVKGQRPYVARRQAAENLLRKVLTRRGRNSPLSASLFDNFFWDCVAIPRIPFVREKVANRFVQFLFYAPLVYTLQWTPQRNVCGVRF